MTEKHLNIMTGLMGHYKDALEHFSENQIIGLFCKEAKIIILMMRLQI